MTRGPICGALVALGAAAPLGAQSPEYETTLLAQGVYQFRADRHQTLFVVTDRGVVAFDPISETAAERYAEEIRRVAPDAPLRAVVYSHHHADHATGAEVLRRALGPDAPVVAHAAARPHLEAAGDPSLPPPEMTFNERLVLWSADRPVELHFLGRSHSDNMLVALLPRERIAFAVDFVTNDGVGFRDLPDYHFPEFFDTLERLLELDFETIAFGHGAPGDRGTVERQVRYYRDLRAAVEEAVRNGWSEERSVAEIELAAYDAWSGYEDWFPLNVRTVYRWVAGSAGRDGS